MLCYSYEYHGVHPIISIKGHNHPVPPSPRMRDSIHQGTFLLQRCLQSSNAWIEEQLENRNSWRIAGIMLVKTDLEANKRAAWS